MYKQIHTPTVVTTGGGGGWMEPAPRSFWYVAVFWNDFTFSGKPLIFSTRWGYFMGSGTAGGLWRHQQWSPSWPPSWILPRIRNQVRTARNGYFLCLGWKITHKYALCMIYFYCWKKLKKHVFSPKMAWPPASYDVISRNHSNWPSLNLSQNVREGWTSSYWKSQVLMFYPLIENSEKPYGGGGRGVASTPLIRPRVKRLIERIYVNTSSDRPPHNL